MSVSRELLPGRHGPFRAVQEDGDLALVGIETMGEPSSALIGRRPFPWPGEAGGAVAA
jgi:hypothetical protein